MMTGLRIISLPLSLSLRYLVANEKVDFRTGFGASDLDRVVLAKWVDR